MIIITPYRLALYTLGSEPFKLQTLTYEAHAPVHS